MRPVDADGSPIHPSTYRKIETIGRALVRHGYIEHDSKHNLFVADYGIVRFYSSLRSTPEVKIWHDERALFYWFWHPKPGPALELRQRMVLLEWVRLRNVAKRLSHALQYDETPTRDEALLVARFDYARRGALFVGGHAAWAEGRFPWDPYDQDEIDAPVRPRDLDALRADSAAKLRAPGAERRQRRVANADPYRLRPARLTLVFRSDRSDDEILAFYEEALRELGWSEAEFRAREQSGRDPGDPWAHDRGGREWTREGWVFRLFLLGGQDRIGYDLSAAPSAFEIWLETPLLAPRGGHT